MEPIEPEETIVPIMPNIESVGRMIHREMDIMVVSYGGSSCNTLVNVLQTQGYRCYTGGWRRIFCHCPKYIECKVPVIYIYDNPIRAFCSIRRRGKGTYDQNQQKLSNNKNVKLSDENLLTLMINQFHEWTNKQRDNVLIIKTEELFQDEIVEKLNHFLKKEIVGFPIEYKKPRTDIKKYTKQNSELFEKYKEELDAIINFQPYELL